MKSSAPEFISWISNLSPPWSKREKILIQAINEKDNEITCLRNALKRKTVFIFSLGAVVVAVALVAALMLAAQHYPYEHYYVETLPRSVFVEAVAYY